MSVSEALHDASPDLPDADDDEGRSCATCGRPVEWMDAEPANRCNARSDTRVLQHVRCEAGHGGVVRIERASGDELSVEGPALEVLRR